MKYGLIAVLVTLFATGCVMTPSVEPDQRRYISAEYDVVWQALVGTIAKEGLTITIMDKETGILNAMSRPYDELLLGTVRQVITGKISNTASNQVEVLLGVSFERNAARYSEAWESMGNSPAGTRYASELFTKIESTVAACNKKGPGISSGAIKATNANDTPEARIKKLKELKESGVLTEEEYQAQRKAIIEKL